MTENISLINSNTYTDSFINDYICDILTIIMYNKDLNKDLKTNGVIDKICYMKYLGTVFFDNRIRKIIDKAYLENSVNKTSFNVDFFVDNFCNYVYSSVNLNIINNAFVEELIKMKDLNELFKLFLEFRTYIDKLNSLRREASDAIKPKMDELLGKVLRDFKFMVIEITEGSYY